MRALDHEGVIRYREVSGVPADAMPAVYADADIVLDQFLIGGYGVAACEAMASGSVVVGHVSPGARDHVRTESGLELPIVEATPRTLTSVVRELVADADRRRTAGDAGRAFVSAVHSGAFSSRVLSAFLSS
jgi:glycosyltransferase involved in cell wall biosynthesis